MYKKISLGLLLTLFGYASQLFVMDETIDARGRTPLMNYVDQQEKELKNLADAFYNKEYQINKLTSIVSHSPENSENRDSINTILKNSIFQLKKLDTEYDKTLADTLEEIVRMIKNGANLAVKDNKNNTVLHICKTKEIYETLRANGAPFQFDTWMTFVEKPSLSTILHTVLIGSLAYSTINHQTNPILSNPFLAYATLSTLGTLRNLDPR